MEGMRISLSRLGGCFRRCHHNVTEQYRSRSSWRRARVIGYWRMASRATIPTNPPMTNVTMATRQIAAGSCSTFGLKAYGEKYKEALVATGIPYKTLTNYASVARRVGQSIREPILGLEKHAAVSKCKPRDQKYWLRMAIKHNLSVRRLRKSIKLGRIATEEDLLSDASDRREITHLHMIDGFLRWWLSETNRTPINEWDVEWRKTIKNDLRRLVEIYNLL